MKANPAASVKARLLALAGGEDFQRTLTRYAAERPPTVRKEVSSV